MNIGKHEKMRLIGSRLVATSLLLAAMSVSAQVPVPEGAPIASSYFDNLFWLWLVEQFVLLGLPCYLLFSGWAAAIAARFERFSGARWPITAAGFAGLYALLYSIIRLPVDYARVVQLNPYFQIPTPSLPSWLLGQVMPIVQWTVIAATLGVIAIWLIRKSRTWCWVWAAGAISIFYIGSLMLRPVTSPQPYVPLESTEYAGWEDRLDTLALRAGATDVPVFVWQTTEQDFCRTRNSVVGLGPTRRVVLADQIFSEWDAGQIDVAFAHELKHYLLDNTWVPVVLVIVLSFSGALFVFAIGTWACRRWGVRFGFGSLARPAALPLLVALVQVYLLAAVPAFNLAAQRIELGADRFALELTRNNHDRARVSADQCGRLWLPEDTLFARLYLNTHPSVAKRIRLANEYRPWETREAGAYGDLIWSFD